MAQWNVTIRAGTSDQSYVSATPPGFRSRGHVGAYFLSTFELSKVVCILSTSIDWFPQQLINPSPTAVRIRILILLRRQELHLGPGRDVLSVRVNDGPCSGY